MKKICKNPLTSSNVSDIIIKRSAKAVCASRSESLEEEIRKIFQKKLKKGIDKGRKMWYNN